MLTGQHVLDMLMILKRKGASSETIAECLERFNGAVQYGDGELHRVQQLITGTLKDERSLAADIREWLEDCNGVFLSSDVVKSLQLSSRNDQKNVSKVLVKNGR